ncbi:MAG: ABC-2 family transporter protein [Patescibacteria group bacterium]
MFRTHFFLSFTAHFLWFLMFILFYTILYKNINTINGWSYDQSLLLLSVFFLIDTTGFTVFIKNFSTFPEYISEGKLDILLTKPVDSQFMICTRYFSLISLFSLGPALFLFIHQIIKMDLALTPLSIALFCIFFLASLIIYASIWFITNIILFWVIKVEMIHEFFVMFFRFMQFPPDIFGGSLRIFFIGIMPVLFTISVPTQALQGIFEPTSIIALVVAAVISLILSRILWKIGLKKYQSAA